MAILCFSNSISRSDDGTMHFSMYALSKKVSKVQDLIRVGQGIQITRDIRNSKGLELKDMEFAWFHQVRITFAARILSCLLLADLEIMDSKRKTSFIRVGDAIGERLLRTRAKDRLRPRKYLSDPTGAG